MVDTERLLDEIRVREYLWNSHAHHYPNKELRRNAWIDVVKTLHPDLVSDKDIYDQVTDYTKKWKHIRDYYLRCKYKIKGKSKEPEYFKSLTFLDIIKDPKGKTTRSSHEGNQLGGNSREPNRLKLMPSNQVETTRSSPEDNQEDSDDPLSSYVYEGEVGNNYEEDDNTTSASTPEPTPIKQEHGTTTRKRTMTQKSTTARFVSSQECSSNKYFLLSLLTDMDKMDDNQNLDFRIAVLNIIKNMKNASE